MSGPLFSCASGIRDASTSWTLAMRSELSVKGVMPTFATSPSLRDLRCWLRSRGVRQPVPPKGGELLGPDVRILRWTTSALSDCPRDDVRDIGSSTGGEDIVGEVGCELAGVLLGSVTAPERRLEVLPFLRRPRMLLLDFFDWASMLLRDSLAVAPLRPVEAGEED